MAPSIFDLFHDLSAALSALGLRWYLFGAQAAIFHGSSRLSADVDATVLVEPQQVDALLGGLAGHGIVPRSPESRSIATQHRVLLLWHERSSMPLDLVLGGAGIEEEFCARARIHDLGGAKIPVISAEDLIAAKILAGRPKDLEDVRAILHVNRKSLDFELVERTLRRFEQALDRSDLLASLSQLSSQWP